MIDIRQLIFDIETTVSTHRLDRPGAYTRWLWQAPIPVPAPANPPKARQLGLNEYGVADAANLLYSIGKFPGEAWERASWIEVFNGLQNPETGLYTEATHHTFHTTAHCIAALELFDVRPKYRLKGMAHLKDRRALETFLNGLNWLGDPWGQSHQGAGIYASLVLAGEVTSQWEDWYFGWLWDEADSRTGMWRRDHVVPIGARGVFPHLAGSFHYLFNHEYAHRPLRYPAKMVDFCLDLYEKKLWPKLGVVVSFAEVDWVYCLTRSLRQSGHRFKESRAALESFAASYIPYLQGLDKKTDDGWNDLHQLFGATCCLAELQQSVPGLLKTEKPLTLVLDRRPFI